jgi:hypothetical protein
MILLVLSNDRKDSDDPIVKERDQAPKIELYGKGYSVTQVTFILFYVFTWEHAVISIFCQFNSSFFFIVLIPQSMKILKSERANASCDDKNVP